MILIMYGVHKKECVAYLTGKYLEAVFADDPFFDFLDLSLIEDHNSKSIGETILNHCNGLNENIDAIIDVHETHVADSSQFFKESTPTFFESASFFLMSFSKTSYPSKLKKFIKEVPKWGEQLKRYGLPLTNKKIFEIHLNSITPAFYIGDFKNRVLPVEFNIFYDEKDDVAASKKIREKYGEIEELSAEEKKERWSELLDVATDILFDNPKNCAVIEEIQKDFVKLLKIMKKYLK